MADTQVSEAQKATRRRALGRRILQKASGVQVIGVEGIRDSQDWRFLTSKEAEILEKQLNAVEKIVANLNKLGDRLEQG